MELNEVRPVDCRHALRSTQVFITSTWSLLRSYLSTSRSEAIQQQRAAAAAAHARRAAPRSPASGWHSLIYLVNPLCTSHCARACVAGAVSLPQDLLQAYCFSAPCCFYPCAFRCRRTCSNGDGAVLTLRNCLALIASKRDQVRYRKDGDSGMCNRQLRCGFAVCGAPAASKETGGGRCSEAPRLSYLNAYKLAWKNGGDP